MLVRREEIVDLDDHDENSPNINGKRIKDEHLICLDDCIERIKSFYIGT